MATTTRSSDPARPSTVRAPLVSYTARGLVALVGLALGVTALALLASTLATAATGLVLTVLGGAFAITVVTALPFLVLRAVGAALAVVEDATAN